MRERLATAFVGALIFHWAQPFIFCQFCSFLVSVSTIDGSTTSHFPISIILHYSSVTGNIGFRRKNVRFQFCKLVLNFGTQTNCVYVVPRKLK